MKDCLLLLYVLLVASSYIIIGWMEYVYSYMYERSCISWFEFGRVGGLFGGLEFVAELLHD